MPRKQLLSDQVDQQEIDIILRELGQILQSGIVGDVVEFGCYVGTTSVFLADALRHGQIELYLYDSFEGLPSKTAQDSSPAGLQFVPGELHATKRQLIDNLRRAGVQMPHIVKGWFSDLTDDDIPESISFAFLDGDYYQSIKDSLRLITPHLAAHSVIVVDDYSNEALPGASRAVDEWCLAHHATVRSQHSLGIIRL